VRFVDFVKHHEDHSKLQSSVKSFFSYEAFKEFKDAFSACDNIFKDYKLKIQGSLFRLKVAVK